MAKSTFRAEFINAAKKAGSSGSGAYFIVGYLSVNFPKESKALEDALDAEALKAEVQQRDAEFASRMVQKTITAGAAS